ncbi:MAG: M23 family metallopeptidase [Anaerofustis stercorihominis]|nr:M23 family metallopeptidase [Anaerofustis stercorihominis]
MSFTGKDRRYRRYFASAGLRSYRRISLLVFVVLFVVYVIGFCVFGLAEEDNTVASVSTGDITDITGTTVHSSLSDSNESEYNVRYDEGILSDEEYFPDYAPAEGVITDGYGFRTDPSPSYHYALDIAGQYASPVYAAASGRIEYASQDDIYGNYVVINHIFNGYKSKYAHLCAYLVTAGQNVKKGDIIGFMGSTGYSTGTHLHFEIIKYNERLDPAKFILITDGRIRF